MTDHTTTRRAVLASAAALPALAIPAVAPAESDDPAIAAARRWIAAEEARAAYTPPDRRDWLDDAHARELDAATEAASTEAMAVRPATAAGLALLLAAFVFAEYGEGMGMRFDAPDRRWNSGTKYDADVFLAGILSTPVGAEMLRRVRA